MVHYKESLEVLREALQRVCQSLAYLRSSHGSKDIE